ncbi:hypothetical protein O0544_12560 [Edwardsiella anguillarum]|nr:hypothetical protein [Edwardsiella anguillarum]
MRLFERQHARLLLNHEGQRLLPVADELLTRMQGWRVCSTMATAILG